MERRIPAWWIMRLSSSGKIYIYLGNEFRCLKIRTRKTRGIEKYAASNRKSGRVAQSKTRAQCAQQAQSRIAAQCTKHVQSRSKCREERKCRAVSIRRKGKKPARINHQNPLENHSSTAGHASIETFQGGSPPRKSLQAQNGNQRCYSIAAISNSGSSMSSSTSESSDSDKTSSSSISA